jgi:hypothetical protein
LGVDVHDSSYKGVKEGGRGRQKGGRREAEGRQKGEKGGRREAEGRQKGGIGRQRSGGEYVEKSCGVGFFKEW